MNGRVERTNSHVSRKEWCGGLDGQVSGADSTAPTRQASELRRRYMQKNKNPVRFWCGMRIKTMSVSIRKEINMQKGKQG